ncbi:neuronal acetylcholine receptor subunit alpha-4-like [Saccoglossus kowalevskii]|uniref:Neuronal acetylcholine receptor subunit alpha-4-like n=1 Tax=Saccoglossus kowalevskii TaxID=10224 RepID=A0ABM0H1I2_SACKO|nr:PREDICTED: neuronal acetylcholine receptor subunit alpha-4-like [Saccoglossus kowalevskii]
MFPLRSQMCRGWIVILVVSWTNTLKCVDSSSVGNPYSRLIRNLLDGYDKLALPFNRTTDSISVKFHVCLRHIEEVLDTHQQITLSAYIRQTWYDTYLSWNTTLYENITEIRLPADEIWHPDTVLYNSANGFTDSSNEISVIVSHDGRVVWDYPALLKSNCAFDVTFVPFDQQTCRMFFGSWSYSSDQVTLSGDLAHLDNLHTNDEWKLIDVTMATGMTVPLQGHESVEGVEMTVVLQRCNEFYLMFMLVPFIMIAGISMLVFLLPPDSGEKLSLCITNLLTLVLYYGQLSRMIPMTVEGTFPIIGTYYFSVVCIVSASCVLTILVLNVHYRKHSNNPAPRWVRRLFFGYCGLHRIAWYSIDSSNSNNNDNERRTTQLSEIMSSQCYVVDSSPVISGIEDGSDNKCETSCNTKQEYASVEDNEWEIMARVLDQVFFITLSLLLFLVTLVCGLKFHIHSYP